MDTHLYTVDTPRKKSTRVTVTIHLTPGKDDDLIKIANSVPKGQRMHVFKSALRGVASGGGAAAFAMPQQMTLPLMADHSGALNVLLDKMEWMEGVINDWPGYFEGLIRQVGTSRPARTKATPASLPPPEPEREQVSQKILDQRSDRLKKASW